MTYTRDVKHLASIALIDQLLAGLEQIVQAKPRKGRFLQFYRLRTLSERFDIPKSVLEELVAFNREERW